MTQAPDREKALELALAQIEKNHGKGSVMRLGDEVRQPISVIPTGSIALDVALGIGGLPRGRVVEIYGPESSGKTTVALHAVANAQAAGGIAAFIDAEHALDPEYAKKLGVDTDSLLVSQPDTGEQALEIADMLIRSGALDILVIDSVAALVPRAEIEGEMGDSHVGLQARLMSQALRKITGALSNSGTTAIFINQLREKIGVMFGCVILHHAGPVWPTAPPRRSARSSTRRWMSRCCPTTRETDQIVPRKVVNWFNNGPAEQFLQFTVEKSGGNGKSQFAATTRTTSSAHRADGREAAISSPAIGCMAAEPHRLSDQQFQVVLGSLMGDGNLSPNRRDRNGVRFRMGHGAKQVGVPGLEDRTAAATSGTRSVRMPRVHGSSTSRRCRSWPSYSARCISVTARSSCLRSTSRRSPRWRWPSGTWTTDHSLCVPRGYSSAPPAAAAASRSAWRR